jgi:hypothetical protein
VEVLREITMVALKADISGKIKGWRDANSTVNSNKANKHGCRTGLNEWMHINRCQHFVLLICELLFTAVSNFRI